VPTQKVALVTGCSTGFGRVIAETLARHNCRVFAGMRDIKRRNSEKAREVREFAAKQSVALSPIEIDVTIDASVDSAIAEVIREAGQIDVLVNNAGLTVRGLAEAVTVEQTRRIFETNVFAVQRMNRAVLPHMRKRTSGLLIHISSQAGRIVLPGLGTYGASKAALESLVESYHYELAAQGIDAVLIQPGAFATAIAQNADKAADEQTESAYGPGAEITKTMMGNLGKRRDPQEVADAVLKLVETPAGKRPLRTGVGVNGEFVGELNEFTDKIQVTVMDFFGLKDLTKFKSH
jgi:NAD(P)-dependent dehydrogenase (short-subunit alcohol dehydrogenase family)